MKKKNLLLIVLIAAVLAGYYGYRTMDLVRTDTQAPKIHMSGEIPQISVQDPRTALLQGITAKDAADGDVTDSLVVESVTLLDSDGNLSVSYAAFDRSGNVAKAERNARYTDYEPPKFTCRAPLLYPYLTNFDNLSTVGAYDVIDGEIQHRVKATSTDENSIASLGIHQVIFQVTNSLGDTSRQTFPVEVYDPETYNAELSLKEYLIYLPRGSAFVPKNYLKTFVVKGEEVNLTAGMPRDYSLKTTGEVLTQNPGTYVVEFRLTYLERHETNPDLDKEFTGYSKMIVIVEE